VVVVGVGMVVVGVGMVVVGVGMVVVGAGTVVPVVAVVAVVVGPSITTGLIVTNVSLNVAGWRVPPCDFGCDTEVSLALLLA